MSEKFLYSLEKAQEEATKMQEKIESGEAENYDEAEKFIGRMKKQPELRHQTRHLLQNELPDKDKNNTESPKVGGEFARALELSRFSSPIKGNNFSERLLEISRGNKENASKIIDLLEKYSAFPKAQSVILDDLYERWGLQEHQLSDMRELIEWLSRPEVKEIIEIFESDYSGGEAKCISRIAELVQAMGGGHFFGDNRDPRALDNKERETLFNYYRTLALEYRDEPAVVQMIGRHLKIEADIEQARLVYDHYNSLEIKSKLKEAYKKYGHFLSALRKRMPSPSKEELQELLTTEITSIEEQLANANDLDGFVHIFNQINAVRFAVIPDIPEDKSDLVSGIRSNDEDLVGFFTMEVSKDCDKLEESLKHEVLKSKFGIDEISPENQIRIQEVIMGLLSGIKSGNESNFEQGLSFDWDAKTYNVKFAVKPYAAHPNTPLSPFFSRAESHCFMTNNVEELWKVPLYATKANIIDSAKYLFHDIYKYKYRDNKEDA